MKQGTQAQSTYNIKTAGLIKLARKNIGDDFIVAKHTRQLYDIVTEYYNDDINFENRFLVTKNRKIKFSLKKGLFLISRPGAGKSFIFEELLPQIAVFFPQKKYRQITAYALENLYAEHGLSAFNHFNTYSQETQFNIYIDDMGRETDKLMSYGRVIPFIDHFIDWRVREQRKGFVTHATSNLSLQDIRNRYSPATFSRMFRLFNFIIIDTNEDFRML